MLSQKPNELRTVVWMLRDRGIETTPANWNATFTAAVLGVAVGILIAILGGWTQ